MGSRELTIENLSFNISQEILVRAPLHATFEALLEQLGPLNEAGEGNLLAMKLEAWPGGRWYRDLGDNNGHFWGVVQAIKKPTLLELSGPMFMSAPTVSNVQYRLSETPEGTLIKFHHWAMGMIPDEARKGVGSGWGFTHNRLRERLEEKRAH